MVNIFIKRHQLGYERRCTVQAMDDFHVRDLEMTPLRFTEVNGHCGFLFHALKFLLVSLSNYWSHRHGATYCNRLQTDRYARSDEGAVAYGGTLTANSGTTFLNINF
jgi:hypothetical protein